MMLRFLLLSLLVAPAISFSTLITFDVDGTLVSSSPGWEQGAHGRSFVHAVDKLLLQNIDDPSKSSSSKVQLKTIPELLEKHEFHGSTDGLILLRLARKMLGDNFDNDLAASKVNDMMDEMFHFVSQCDDSEVSRGIAPLPGVLDTFTTLEQKYNNGNVAYGLVTGNVEGIARRKMNALGIHATNALTSLSVPQGGREWEGVEHLRFLGGFGSDYCSASIDDPTRNYLDRGEQLAICVQRCLALKGDADNYATKTKEKMISQLDRVIHVGDAPADILAAKSYVNHPTKPANVCVSVVGVATGSYSVDELQDLCGDTIPGVWEPVVLEEGMGVGNEDVFLKACGLV